MASPSRSPSTLLAGGVLGAALAAAYANSLHGPFVFDDASSITTNPTIRSLWPLSGPLSPPTTNVTAQGRPILNLSLAVNYAFGGTAVQGYHAVNALIHGLAGLTLFGLLRRTLAPAPAAGWLALAVAGLWIVHPLQTESVTYVIQRTESLMGLFYLLTLYCFARGVEPERASAVSPGPEGGSGTAGAGAAVRGRWLGLAVAACALGMATKEVMATAPLMVWFYDRSFVAPSFAAALRRRAGFYAALCATWGLLGWLVWQGGGNRGGSVGFGSGVAPWAYWLTQLEAVAAYLRLSFWPAPLVFEYGTFWIERASEIAVEAAVLLGLLAVTVAGLARRRAFGFAGAWFFGILAPTSLAPGTTQMIVEHRMYLPLAAVLAVTVVGLHRLATARGGVRGAAAVWIGCAAAGLACVVLTARRNTDYRTDVALWTDTIAKRPENPLAHFMLAGAWERAGETERALAAYAEALRLKPAFSVGRENYGALLLKLGRRAEAIVQFEAALALQPEFADAHANLGNALLAEGRVAEAVRHLGEAVRIAPGFAETHYNYGNALAAAGRVEEAAAQYGTALRVKPGVAEVHFNLGNALDALGRGAEAIAQFRAAVAARPDFAAAHYNLANALARAGAPAEAVPAYEAAVRAKPDYAEAHHNLGSACFELGRYADAVRHYEAALRLAPDFPGARERLDAARARLRP